MAERDLSERDLPDAEASTTPGASGSEPPSGPPRNRFEIRILPDGTVVFVDLPRGLAEVAQVVAGSAPESVPGDTTPTGEAG